MKAIRIRNLRDETLEALQRIAARNHRSLEEQVRCVLEREVALHKGDPLARAEQWRERLRGRTAGDTVAGIREDRYR